MNNKNEILVLAGVKPVPYTQQLQRNLKKAFNRAFFNLGLAFIILVTVICGIFSQKAACYCAGLAWLLIYWEENENRN